MAYLHGAKLIAAVDLLACLGQFAWQSKQLNPKLKWIDIPDIARAHENVSFLNDHLTELGLPVSAKVAWRLLKTIELVNVPVDALNALIRQLNGRIKDELESHTFIHIDPALTQYYSTPDLFGPEVTKKFPKAIDDIEEAGKCLALGCGTAAVMHLMRVMEVGLRELGKALKIPYAPSWESYLNQISARIAAKHKTKSIVWKRDEPFYRDVSGDLLTIKQAWRNPTMHVARKYSASEAEEIFRAVRRLMSRLASR